MKLKFHVYGILFYVYLFSSVCQFFSATKTGEFDYLVRLYIHLIEVSFSI